MAKLTRYRSVDKTFLNVISAFAQQIAIDLLIANVRECAVKTGDEGVKGEGKDYEFTLVVDSIDDRFYLDADDFADKFKSNHTDVGLCSNIDFPNLDFTSKIPNTVYRKMEGECISEIYQNNWILLMLIISPIMLFLLWQEEIGKQIFFAWITSFADDDDISTMQMGLKIGRLLGRNGNAHSDCVVWEMNTSYQRASDITVRHFFGGCGTGNKPDSALRYIFSTFIHHTSGKGWPKRLKGNVFPIGNIYCEGSEFSNM
ncbi:hypothetical protein HZH68_016196 [Vespula germanica]|uniref:Uncharacterized protein n=1 Tax=Vespula germanica TaxID=30212 RepID=A0A834J186_VESGE|nr:hypothetical protein HZH68_016196 [Vespula germanica]